MQKNNYKGILRSSVPKNPNHGDWYIEIKSENNKEAHMCVYAFGIWHSLSMSNDTYSSMKELLRDKSIDIIFNGDN